MLKLPTHSQKPSRAPHAVLDGDIQWEDDDGDDHPSGGDGKRPLTTCQAILASVVGSSHVSLGGFLFLVLWHEETHANENTSPRRG
jgi:hypothetical protein